MQDLQKKKRWESMKYLAYVRTLPSCISEQIGTEPHHIKGHGFGGSVKAADWAVIPLTRMEHTDLHSRGWQSWEERHGSQLEYVARTLGRAIEEGILK
jgi:hypothetical protein